MAAVVPVNYPNLALLVGTYDDGSPQGVPTQVAVDADGNVLIDGNITLDPTNLATSAKQDTGNGSLATINTSLATWTHVGSSVMEKSHVISAVACRLRSAKALNNTAGALWLYVLDAASLPGDGATPSRTPIPIPAGAVNGDTWEGGTAMATGCVLALSSTLATLTLVSTANAWFDAEKI